MLAEGNTLNVGGAGGDSSGKRTSCDGDGKRKAAAAADAEVDGRETEIIAAARTSEVQSCDRGYGLGLRDGWQSSRSSGCQESFEEWRHDFLRLRRWLMYFNGFTGVVIERSSSLEETEKLLFRVWKDRLSTHNRSVIYPIFSGQVRSQTRLVEWMRANSR
jgi:hypothetical protein